MRTPLLISLLAWLATSGLQMSPAGPTGSGTTLETADSLVADWIDSERIPGAVLLVSRDGQVLIEKAYGWAQSFGYGDGEYGTSAADSLRALDPRHAMAPQALFDVASVTKVMATTMAVMHLVDRGSIDLDAPVHTWLQDFRGGGKDAITPRHLLTHRSGLAQWEPVYYHADKADSAYAYVRDLPLKWKVGEGRHYSDLGFMVLGRLVEAVSGAGLDTYVRSHIYTPLGLLSTGFRPTSGSARPRAGGVFAATSHGNPYERRMVHDSTFGYVIEGDPNSWNGWRRRTLIGEVNDGNAHHAFGGVAGHAGLFSDAADLTALLQLLLDRGESHGTRIFRPEIVDDFLRPTGDAQALGWQVPSFAPEGSFTHSGFTGTFVLGVPSERLTVVLLTNRQNGGRDPTGLYPDVGPLQRGVVSALLGG